MRRLFIVGDDAFIVHGMRFALRYASGVSLFGVVDGHGKVREAIREAQPDIVVVDGLNDKDIAARRVREVRDAAPTAAIVLLSAPVDDPSIQEVLEAGVLACVAGTLPASDAERPVAARAITGPAPVPTPVPAPAPTPVAAVAPRPDPPAEEESRPAAHRTPLTARELEILRAVAEGHTNAHVGRQLWVTEQTVKFHLSNIYRKLGVSNRTEASRYALLHGLATLPRRPAPADADAPRLREAG
jgi:DNA-binding NarL/FixJ family response regulator